MSFHRIRLNQIQPNNQSFSHQQSLNVQLDQKHAKKSSLHPKPSRRSKYQRTVTEERQSPAVFKNQAINSCANSMHLAHQTNFSTSKLGRPQQRPAIPQGKKSKKPKQTISVINLNKNLQESKIKLSSTVTKRKQSAVDLGERLKQKVQDFRVISTCVEEYVREERRNNSQVNLSQIIKIISAFNRSEIAPLSKPLERLIADIVSAIQNSLPQPQLRSILKKSITFQNSEEKIPKQKSTIKKQIIHRQVQSNQQQGQSRRLQENLSALKYESNRLKNFLEQIAYKHKAEGKKAGLAPQVEQGKLKQLKQLKQIAQQQARLMRQLEDSEDSNTFRSDSPQ